MTMLDIFKDTIKSIPVTLNIISVKEGYSKSKLRVESNGVEVDAELRKTCAPGAESDYCWQVITTVMADICFHMGDTEAALRWLNAAQDREIIMRGSDTDAGEN